MKFGPFWLEARLAVGGTAEVYLARPIDPQAQPRKLVVKRLLPHFVADPEGRTMFEREAALHAAVVSDHVVQVYGSGVERDEPWLAMEWVDGCDLFRLLRRMTSTNQSVGRGMCAYVARELLRGLESVHTVRDAAGQPMVIIHRDVTPSNIYLSTDGRVKLGDFGIARSASRATLSTAGPVLKGKFAYLAPEQVAGEPFDQRADLFATAVVVAEMLIGRPLFAGSGQLAVLLAIRDCRIEPLRDARANMPPGMFEVMERALARDPAARYPTAAALREALAPFDRNPVAARAELGALVRWVQSAPSAEQMQAVRDTAKRLRAAAALTFPPEDSTEPEAPKAPDREKSDAKPVSRAEAKDEEKDTGQYAPIPSFVTTVNGDRMGPWPFARLVEAIATGEVGRNDRVEYMGRSAAALGSIAELARFLPALTADTTNRLAGVSSPDFSDAVSPASLVMVLANVVDGGITGVLFAEGPTESQRILANATGATGRKELYFVGGKLAHITSSNASELLGEYLVRRGDISRTELDFALAVLPRYEGRMGDTLASLGLMPSLEIFRAIREQGRDRVIDLFGWRTGTLTFYKDQTAPHVEFPLELDLPPLIVAGYEAATPGEMPLETWRGRLDDLLAPAATPRPRLYAAGWPAVERRVLDLAQRPVRVREVLALTARDLAPTLVLRAIDILFAAKLVTRR
ncbi:MAG TPA: protein kinase [Polyangiaceae bacterium]|jgi:serine/threonine-protein kinase|nr:protein kinase [Polyangiaceae bacterium]